MRYQIINQYPNWQGFDFRRPKYSAMILIYDWFLYLGWWEIRKWKYPSATQTDIDDFYSSGKIMNDEILVPLDLSDAIAMIDRQKQQIADFEKVVKVFQDDTVMRKAHIEHLEGQTAALTTELGTVKEILRQLNDRDKRMIWEKEEALRGEEK